MAEETLVDIEEQKEENKVDIMSMTSNELIGQLMDINDKPSLSEQESEYKKLVVAELKNRKTNKPTISKITPNTIRIRLLID